MNVQVLKHQLVRNTLLAGLGELVNVLVGFILTPIIIALLGPAIFGLNITFIFTFAWVGMLDLGLVLGLTKVLSEYRGSQNDVAYRRTCATIFYFYGVTGAIVFIITALFSKPIVLLLSELGREPWAGPTLVLYALLWWLSNVMRIFGYILQGNQRMDVANIVSLIFQLLSVAGIPVVLKIYPTLATFLWFSVGMILSQGITLWLCLKSLRIPFSLSPADVRWEPLQRLFSFGAKLQASYLLFRIYSQGDRLIIGSILRQPEAVTYYQIGANPVDRLVSLTASLVGAIVPASSELAARQNVDAVRALYRRSAKYLGFVGIFVMSFCAVFADELLVLWIGHSLPGASLVLQIMAVSAAVRLIASPADSIGAGLGRTDLHFWAALASFFYWLGFYGLYLYSYGWIGLAGSVSAAFITYNLCYLWLFCRATGIKLDRDWWMGILKPIVAALPLAGIYLATQALEEIWNYSPTRLNALAVLLPAGLAFSSAYALLLWTMRAFDERDREVWQMIVGRFKKRPTG